MTSGAGRRNVGMTSSVHFSCKVERTRPCSSFINSLDSSLWWLMYVFLLETARCEQSQNLYTQYNSFKVNSATFFTYRSDITRWPQSANHIAAMQCIRSCRYSARANLRNNAMALILTLIWLLVWVFWKLLISWDFHALRGCRVYSEGCEKHSSSVSSVGGNAMLIREDRGDGFELK